MYSVGNLFSTVSKFYNEINPATLSGAIDIIVVQQPNGDLACSPFHVRFGKLSVLRPQDKVVEVRVNGQVIPFQMKVGDLGECFFVLTTEDDVPDEFATSPIAKPEDDAKLQPVDYFELDGNKYKQQQQQQQQQEQPEHDGTDLPLDNGYVSAASGHGSAFEESLKGDDSDHESIVSELTSPTSGPVSPSQRLGTMPGSFYEPEEPEAPLPSAAVGTGSSAIHIRETQEIDFPVDKVFPTVVHHEDPSAAEYTAGSNISAHHKGEVLLDMTGYKTDSCSESDDDGYDFPSGILSDSERRHRGFRRKYGRAPKHRLTEKERLQLIEDIRKGNFGRPDENTKVTTQATTVDTEDSNEQQKKAQQQRHRKKKRTGAGHGTPRRKGRKRAYSMPSIGESELALLYAQSLEEMKNARTSVKSNGVPRSDELKKADTLPRRSARPQVLSDTEMDYESNAPAQKGSEWGWGWGSLPTKKDGDESRGDTKEQEKPAAPVEIETREFQMGSTKCRVAMSLCGEEELGKDQATSHSAFQAKQVTFEMFAKDPSSILANKNLVCYIDGRFYTWANAVPQLTALLFFHQPLPGQELGKDIKDGGSMAGGDRPSSTRFGAISRWFRKSPTGSSAAPADSSARNLNDSTVEASPGFASDEEPLSANLAVRSKSLPPADTHNHDHHHAKTSSSSPSTSQEDEEKKQKPAEKKNYAKTLRLSSEQLKQLNLNKGANTVSFSVTSSYQGTATCVAKIFLWDYDAQVVISDIDGTITKSDALGHIFAMAGRDWTHLGVAKLFTDIRSNGYQILYLTSRAIGQADYTRKYLQKVEQNSYQLPDGPVIMSPDRLFSAFHREVIIRKPEVFKMACLRDVKKLFGDRSPFYAGFGNRITDALSYRSVNVPPSRIFTIDSYGEVKLELLSAFKSSYIALNDLVNEIFPGQRVAPEYNDWNYWKTDLSAVKLPELPLAPNTYGTSPSSTSLLPSSVKKVLTHSNSSTFSVTSSTSATVTTTTSTTTTSVGAAGGSTAASSPSSKTYHRLSYDTRSSSSTSTSVVTRTQQEGWTSDDEKAYQEQQQKGAEASQDDASNNRATRASSPSMLASLVPKRLIRAVRSGSMSGSTSSSPPRPGLNSSATSPPATSESSPSMSSPVEASATDMTAAAGASSSSLQRGASDGIVPKLKETIEYVSATTAAVVASELAQVGEAEENLNSRETETGQSNTEAYVGGEDEGRFVEDALMEDQEEDEFYDGEEEDDNEDELEGYEEDEEDDDDYLDKIKEDLEEPFL
ncbi:hypothetical protein BGW41_001944 [Actinomortierella wolfii]|nr:hypothetical protein BGW41_001944 [Actinomortierella wolfii]